MTRAIAKTFDQLRREGKKAFIPFITAGDPDLDTTVRLVLELEHAGSNIVELGVPFSDPLADGPVIQRASERTLRKGYRLADYLEVVRRIRLETSMPLILFSYFNPILRYGLEDFARDARKAGVDGILVTDMTPEEAGEYCFCLERYELDPIFLVAPTSSSARIEKICGYARGFIYLVSRTGITGAQEKLSDSILPTLSRVRECTSLPVVVGFGISRPEHVQAVWSLADGAVVGSAIVAEIERGRSSPDLPAQIGTFCRWLTGNKATS